MHTPTPHDRTADSVLDEARQRTNEFALQHGVPLRTAATSLAVKAVADAPRMRGLYP
jgi:hypothetical protein